jgi:LacI family transcriptional regulator
MVAGLLAILPGSLLLHLIARSQEGLPLVVIDDQQQPADLPFPWVGVDNISSAYQATRYLLDQGYRRIAHILGPQHYYCALERYQGYCHALQDAGIVIDPTLLLQGNFDPLSGRQCALDLFSRDRHTWPDAIFVGNDQMAYGVLEVAQELGIQIPDEIALMGFDDNILSAHMRPPLTTIHQPFSEMGRKAIEILLARIDPDHYAAHRQQKGNASLGTDRSLEVGPTEMNLPIHIQLPTSLVVRASCGVARSLGSTW